VKVLGRTQPLAHYEIDECLAVISQLGFDGVEICLENDDLHPGQLDSERAAQIHARVEALGLGPHSVSYHKDYIYDDGLFEQTKQAIRLTRAFGTHIFVFSGTRRKGEDEASAWRRMVARTQALVEIAADFEVVLAEEFEPGFIVGSTADLLRLFDEVPSPYLAVNLDLGHVFLCDPDPLSSIRQVGHKVVHSHIENMRAGVHDHMLPWVGDMDLAAYLQALADVGFDGGLALDLYKYDYEDVALKCISYLSKLLERVGAS
jgi:sugar phosphate isomerase/epimerase